MMNLVLYLTCHIKLIPGGFYFLSNFEMLSVYLLSAALGLCCCAEAFSNCGGQGHSQGTRAPHWGDSFHFGAQAICRRPQ